MAHPYKDQAPGGRATAAKRYADGGSASTPVIGPPQKDDIWGRMTAARTGGGGPDLVKKTAQELNAAKVPKKASGGRTPQVSTASVELEQSFKDEPGMVNFGRVSDYTPESQYRRHGSGLADEARNVAAQRTRSSVARKSGGKVK